MASIHTTAAGEPAKFRRGDANADGRLNITDPIGTLGYLFLGKTAPTCLDAADSDDSGRIDINDPVLVLNVLFLGRGAIPPPGPTQCGFDLSLDELGCDRHEPCAPPSTLRPPSPVLDRETDATRERFTSVSGYASPSHLVEVTCGVCTLVVGTDGTGRFTTELPLELNSRNRIFVTAMAPDGTRSAPTPFLVIQDEKEPFLHVDYPRDGAIVTQESVTVIGRVGDLLCGDLGIGVEVDGRPAHVVVGLGTNGTFELAGVPLPSRSNRIEVTATDILGNRLRREIKVTRSDVTGARLVVAGGDGQGAPARGLLSAPAAVKVTDEDGDPVRGKLVAFEVTRSDGALYEATAKPVLHGEEGVRSLKVETGADGIASVRWRMGTDAGCGNNRLRATATGISDVVIFCASAWAPEPTQINIGSGDRQQVEAGAAAVYPLRVWVSDGVNGIAGVPVTFSAFEGRGLVLGAESATVETGLTGHAEVSFVAGQEPEMNLVRATFPNNGGLPSVFSIQGLRRGQEDSTTFAGVVLDNAERPLRGVLCILEVANHEASQAWTDDDGSFRIEAYGVGPAWLYVEGLTATRIGGPSPREIPRGTFPSLSYDVVVVPGIQNSLPGPIYLPELDPRNARIYDGTQDVTLTTQGLEGLEMVVKAGSMRLRDGRKPSPERPVAAALNPVNTFKIPMPAPDGMAPPFAWTLQPSGATFDPPVSIRFPNMLGLRPGAITNFASFDHDTNRFEVVATGQVTQDGSFILSDPGSGIPKAGWGFADSEAEETGSVDNCGESSCSVELPVSLDCGTGAFQLEIEITNTGPCEGSFAWSVDQRSGDVSLSIPEASGTVGLEAGAAAQIPLDLSIDPTDTGLAAISILVTSETGAEATCETTGYLLFTGAEGSGAGVDPNVCMTALDPALDLLFEEDFEEEVAADVAIVILAANVTVGIDSQGNAIFADDGTVVRWELEGPSGGSLSETETTTEGGVAVNYLYTTTVAGDKFAVNAATSEVLYAGEAFSVELSAASNEVTVIPGAAATLEADVGTTSLPSDDVSTTSIVVTALDVAGNEVADGTSVIWDYDGLGDLIDASSETEGGVAFVDVKAGWDGEDDHEVTVSIDDIETTIDLSDRAIQIGLSFEAGSSSELEADSGDTTTIVATVQDASGSSIVDGTPIEWFTQKGTITGDSVTTDGKAKAVLAATGGSNRPGTNTVVASVANNIGEMQIDFIAPTEAIYIETERPVLAGDGTADGTIAILQPDDDDDGIDDFEEFPLYRVCQGALGNVPIGSDVTLSISNADYVSLRADWDGDGALDADADGDGLSDRDGGDRTLTITVERSGQLEFTVESRGTFNDSEVPEYAAYKIEIQAIIEAPDTTAALLGERGGGATAFTVVTYVTIVKPELWGQALNYVKRFAWDGIVLGSGEGHVEVAGDLFISLLPVVGAYADLRDFAKELAKLRHGPLPASSWAIVILSVVGLVCEFHPACKGSVDIVLSVFKVVIKKLGTRGLKVLLRFLRDESGSFSLEAFLQLISDAKNLDAAGIIERIIITSTKHWDELKWFMGMFDSWTDGAQVLIKAWDTHGADSVTKRLLPTMRNLAESDIRFLIENDAIEAISLAAARQGSYGWKKAEIEDFILILLERKSLALKILEIADVDGAGLAVRKIIKQFSNPANLEGSEFEIDVARLLRNTGEELTGLGLYLKDSAGKALIELGDIDVLTTQVAVEVKKMDILQLLGQALWSKEGKLRKRKAALASGSGQKLAVAIPEESLSGADPRLLETLKAYIDEINAEGLPEIVLMKVSSARSSISVVDLAELIK